MSTDLQIRNTAFNWLNQQIDIHGDVLSRDLLRRGFEFRGVRIPLVSPQGIFKPKEMDLPLTITTSPKGPYDDSFNYHDQLLYKYRGTDLNHRDNVGLREIMKQELPLIYFHGIIPGRYLAIFPVYIIEDNPQNLSFTVVADEKVINPESEESEFVGVKDEGRRSYITSQVRQRVHQRGFRERVLQAYRSQCAFCNLKHGELLDAAHIVPDGEPDGTPTVENGLALCKIHHSAFDKFIIGVTPDYQIKIRTDLLEEIDGPMLTYGFQKLHDQKLILPKSKKAWPSREKLDWRHQKFVGI
ncbi:HNH endonuclease [Rhodohalobacter sp. SW132]|uniref:HNH endonuclease n=1 Tax=Rhodohalobacter sp. SW132 TaxID=2293433 RepID=UPI000E25F491|nr:HNH endonuclease [Rhodohalobacter sp. SW132]REL24508.1 HNH endonuclease [Rhodohalobacter sp. SW132]